MLKLAENPITVCVYRGPFLYPTLTVETESTYEKNCINCLPFEIEPCFQTAIQ